MWRSLTGALLLLLITVGPAAAQGRSFEEQRDPTVQQLHQMHFITMVQEYLHQYEGYEFSREWSLGDPTKLYGYFPDFTGGGRVVWPSPRVLTKSVH